VAIAVMVVDDQEMVRAGFGALLNSQPDIEVVGQAGDGAQAVELAAELKPDVILMDVRMPVLDGLAATRRILAGSAPGEPPRVVMLTTFDLDDYVYAALRAGASGFLLKHSTPDELAAAVRVVGGGLRSCATRRTGDTGPADAAGGRRTAAGRAGTVQPADRRRTGAGRADREDARQQHPHQAGPP